MRILFVEHTAGHNPNKTYEKPTGGTLTSLTFVTEYLAAKGHDVYVQSTHEVEETINGVKYILSESHIPKWDVIVFGRNVLPRDFVTYNKQNNVKIIWWLHDIVDTRYLPDDSFKMVDHIVALSEYCRETYSDFYDLPKDKFTVISNGVDPKIFYPGDYARRNPNVYLVASAPIKGLMPLEAVQKNMLRHNPDFDLRIYSNQQLHGLKNSNTQDSQLSHLQREGAHLYAPVNPEVLAFLMRKAWCLLLPNSYPEICSNLLLQARACGLPIVTSDIGANKEFIEDGKTGLMTTKYKPHDLFSWIVEYTNRALSLHLNKDLHKRISEQTPQGVPTWEGIGNAWDDLLSKVVAEPVQVVEKLPASTEVDC